MDKHISIIGIGGAGSKIAEYLQSNLNHPSQLLLVNSEKKYLDKRVATGKYFLDADKSAESRPDLKIQNMAKQSSSFFNDHIKNGQQVILVVGLGGITGTHSLPEIIRILTSHNAKIVLITTLPFKFESQRRFLAIEKLSELKKFQNIAFIEFDNERVCKLEAKNMSLLEGFEHVNKVILDSLLTKLDLRS